MKQENRMDELSQGIKVLQDGKVRQEGNSIPCYCKNDKHTLYHASIRTQQSTRQGYSSRSLDNPDDIVEIWNCLFLYHIFACKYTLMMAVPSCYNIKELTKLSRQMEEEPAPTTMLYWILSFWERSSDSKRNQAFLSYGGNGKMISSHVPQRPSSLL